jgi:hypothetical protein
MMDKKDLINILRALTVTTNAISTQSIRQLGQHAMAGATSGAVMLKCGGFPQEVMSALSRMLTRACPEEGMRKTRQRE